MRICQTQWSEVKTHQTQGQQELQRQWTDYKKAEKRLPLYSDWLYRAVARLSIQPISKHGRRKQTNEHVSLPVSIVLPLKPISSVLNDRVEKPNYTVSHMQVTPSQSSITLWQSSYSLGCLCWFSRDISQTITFQSSYLKFILFLSEFFLKQVLLSDDLIQFSLLDQLFL